MNKIYKVIWSKVTQSFVVVSELASSQGKAKSSVVNQQSKLSSLLSICFQLSAVAIPLFSTIQTASATSIAIGATTAANATTSNGSSTNGIDSIAIGNTSKAIGPGSIAIGVNATAYITDAGDRSQGAVAIGASSVANGNQSVALGDAAQATGAQSSAIGNNAYATGFGSIVIGGDDTGSSVNTTTDPYNYQNLRSNIGYLKNSGNNYRNSLASGVGSVVVGVHGQALSNGSTAIGVYATAGDNGVETRYSNTSTTAIEATAVGAFARARDAHSTAIGYKANSFGENSTAIGSLAQTNGTNATAIGLDTKASANDSIAIGTGDNVTGTMSGAIGGSTKVSANSSYSLGNNNNITTNANNSFVVGNNVTATDANSVILGNGSSGTATVNSTNSATINTITYSTFAGVGSQAKGYVSVGSKNNERQIKNVAAGEISATSTDAINGSQLYVVADTLSKKIPTVVAGNNTNIASTTSTTGTKGPVYTVNAYNTTAKAGSTSVNVTEKVNGYNISYEIDLSQTTKTTIETANTTAHAANATANTANTTANAANTTANTANGTANTANNTANTANNTANTANNTANTANKTANLANTTANTANATVNKGWNITTSQSSGSVSGNESKNVQMGETVTIDAGQNINITQSDKKISIATSMTPTFTSATFGGTTINSDGLTITNGPSVTTSGINAGNKTITNLANGVNNSDAVNKGQLEVVNTTANAANTTANTANGTANTANGTANTANTTANAANTTANTANGTANTANTTANTANTTANAANTTANIANATVNKGWNITTSASDGSATNTTDENVQMGENVTIDAGQNINITQNGQKISIATSMTPTFTSATFGDTLIQNDGLTIVGGPSITKSGINAGSKTITNVAAGVNTTDAVNKGQLDAVNTTATTANNTANAANTTANTANTTANAANTTANAANATVNKGWNITTSASTGGNASGTENKNVQMGDTVTIDAGQNINITQSGQNISIATSMTPTFTNATFGDTLINSDGLTITAGPSITKSGVNAGNKNITNVATPIAGTDAANKDYVDNFTLTYKGDNNTNGSNKLTETVTFAGTDKQIVTTAENGKVSFKLADEVNASLSKADSALQSFTVGADNKGVNATINNTSTHFDIVGTPNYVNTTVNGQNITVDIAQSFKDTVTNNTQNISNNAQNITNNANNITNNTNNITNNTNNITKNTGDIANNTQNITKNATEIAKGFGLKAQDGQEITKALGEKVEVIGGNDNINTSVANGKIQVNLNNTLNLTNAGSVTVGNSTINDNGLNITNGTTTVSLTEKGLDNGNQTITHVANGTNGTDAVNKSQLDAVNATANAGWKLQANGTNESTVTPNETVSLNNTDNNIVISKDSSNDNVTFNLAKNLTDLTSAAFGGTSINNDGLTIKDGPNVTKSGIDAANTKITNVTNGTVDATSKDAVNGSQLYATNQNVTNLNTTVSKGLTFNTTDTSTEFNRKLGDTITINGGADASAATAAGNIKVKMDNGVISLDLLSNLTNLTSAVFTNATNNLTVTGDGITVTNGTNTTSLTVNGLDNGNNTITHVANGTNGTDAVNFDQLKAVNATANAGWNFNTSGNVTKTNVAPNNTVTFNGNSNINVTHNGSTLNVSLNNTVDLGTSGSLKVNSTTINNNGTISGVTNGTLSTTSTEAVNGSQLFATNQNVANNTQNIANNTATINKGTMYGGDIGNAFTLKLGEQANVKGGISDTTALTDNNLGVVSDGTNTLMVKLAKELTNLTSATFGNDTTDKTVINKDGVTITNGTDTISLTENGLDNGNKTITNVKAGVNDTDAVNKAQLDAVTTTANAGWKLQANGTNESTVTPNETVSLNNTDNNIVISKDSSNDNVTFNLAKNLTDLTSAAFGGTSINNDGLTIKDGPNVTKSGIDAANTKITNVTNGTVDATSKDAVNGSQLYATNQNVTNLNTTVSKGLTFNTTDTSTEFNRKLGDTITINGGADASAATAAGNIKVKMDNGVISLDLLSNLTNLTSAVFTNATNNLTVTGDGITVTNGTNTTSLTVNGLDNGNNTITHVANGTNGTDAVNFDQLKAVNATANAGWNFNTSGNVTKTNVAPNNTVTFNGNSNINVTHNGSTLNVSLNNTVDLGTSGSLKVNSTTINNNGTISGVTNGTLSTTSTEAVNGSQLFATNQNVANNTQNIANNTATINKGTMYGGDIGNAFTLKLGEQANVKGGISDTTALTDNNLGVVSDGTNTLMVKLAKELTNLTSATFGNDTTDKTVINKDGVTITNGTDTISLTENGLDNGNKTITNVKAGVNDTDAVNKAQLDAVTTTANAGWKLQANGTNESTVTPNETVSLNNTDNNIVISKDSSNDNVTFNLAKNLTDLTSAAFGGTSINNDGLTIKDGPNVTKSGIDAANTKITNVTDGAVDANSKDAVNGSQLYATNQNVTNLNTTVSKGLTFNTTDTNTEFNRKLGDTITINGGADASAATAAGNIKVKMDNGVISLDLLSNLTNLTSAVFTNATNNSTVTGDGITVTNGTNTTSLTVNGLDNGNNTITHVANGTNGTDAVNFDQLKAVNATANAGWNFNTSGNAIKTNVAPNGTVTFNGDNNIKVTHNGSTLNVSLNNTVDLGTSGSLKVNSTTINNNGTISGVTNGTLSTTSTEAVNGSQLFATNQNVANNTQNIANNTATINKGTMYGGDIGTNFTRKLGEQTNVKGGITDESKLSDNNLGVVSDNTNNTLMVKLAKDLNLTSDGSVTMGDTLLNSTGLTITNGPSVTNNGIQAGNKQITNVSSGLGGTALKDASGDTLKNVANIGDLQTVINNVTNASAGGGFGLTDDKGKPVTQDLGKTIALNGKDGITVTANTASDGLEIGLGNNVTIGSKDGVAGIVNVKDKDGDDTITLDAGNSTVNIGSNGAAGSIGLNGLDGTVGINGKDGTNASITVANGTKGIDGNDLASGANKTRIVYENANGSSEQVATLNDGLYFTGDNTTVNISKKLNETLTIKGNLSQTANVTDQNLRVDVVDNALVIKMAKELTDLTNATFGSGTDKTVIDKDGVTITNGSDTVSLTENGLNNGNKTITNVANGTNGTDAVNKDQLDAVNASANAGWILTDGTNSSTVKPNSTVTLTNTDNNILIVNDGNNVTFTLADNLNATTITLKGDSGTNGTIGLDGANGTIGLTGKDGASANITVVNGTNGIDGTNTTRITYDNQTVATLNDGLFFTGDDTNVTVGKKLNETLTIKGNLSQTANVTDQNLRVDVVDNALVIKMAKELTNLTNATFGSGTDKTVIDKDGVTITNGTNTVSLTETGLNNGNNTITNVSSGLVNNADGSNVTLANATGDTLTNVVNVGDLKNSIHNITNASAGGGFGLTDDKGDKVTQDLGKTIALNGKDGITVTANTTLGGLEVGLGNNVTIGGKEGTSGVVNVKDKDGDNAITLDAENATVSIGSDGLPGSIGLDGTNGTIGIIGKDGTNASITVTDGAKGLAGNDGLNGASKTRITYTKSDGTPEEVATLNDGLQFVGDDGKVITKKLNEQLSIKGNLSTTANVTDKNLRVDNENGELIIKMAKELRDLTNATFISGNSQSVLDGNGFTITSNVAGKNPVSLTDNGLDNGGNVISNVGAGVADTDAVNMSQLNAVNATANAGWILTDGTNSSTVKPNSTVALTNTDKNINITNKDGNVTFDLAKDIDLGANGSMKIGNTTVDNNGLTVGNTTVTDNGLTIAGGPSVTQAGIDAGNKKLTGVLAGDISATSTDAINGAQIYQVEQNVKAAKTEVEAGNNVNVSTTTGKNGQTVYTVATASDVDFDKVTVGDVTISKDSGINAGNHQVANVANGKIAADSKDAVNGSQLYATNQNVTNLEQEVSKGWNVTTGMVDGSTGTVTGNSTTKVAMGDTVSVKAGNNIAITQDGKNIAIATSMTPTFDSVTVGTKGNSAKIGTTTDNYGNAISVTGDDGVSPTRITNVAAGQANNDAVNVSQVRNMANHINSSINKVDKNLRAGIAGAMAAGNLYHVTLPGKSMVAAGAGVYKGEGAVAVGYSRLSDNGKIGIKFSVNSNTRGDTGAAASVGYQW
ncbi:ESPR-type extended signal peptide-containing protein [Lonepinella sp. MS14435]|uniref:ESPR-type extended signal peptide-containing protein n=1 Tax=Lonepinella sp. MS14435 TaxID=3003618 RepID=UPI0036DE3DF0